MIDSPAIGRPIQGAVLNATLDELGGERLEASGFEGETPDMLDGQQTEEVEP
jgi:hypothetical protein